MPQKIGQEEFACALHGRKGLIWGKHRNEEEKKKEKTGEEERSGQESASWSADTDQEHRQNVWKREAVWEE